MTAPPQNLVQVNGITQVSDSNLNTYVQWAQSVTGLRSFIGITGMTINLQGLVSAGDGGQGVFYWNSAAGQTDNGLTVIIPNGASSGAWNKLTNPATVTYSLQVPLTGFNITAGDYVNSLLLNPAGTLATGTVKMPLNFLDGGIFGISSSQTVTTLTTTANTGQTLIGAGTTITSTTPLKWIYQLSNKTWYRY